MDAGPVFGPVVRSQEYCRNRDTGKAVRGSFWPLGDELTQEWVANTAHDRKSRPRYYGANRFWLGSYACEY